MTWTDLLTSLGPFLGVWLGILDSHLTTPGLFLSLDWEDVWEVSR